MSFGQTGVSPMSFSSEQEADKFPCPSPLLYTVPCASPETRVFLDPVIYPQPSLASPCSHFLRCFRLHYPIVRAHLLTALEWSSADDHSSRVTCRRAEVHMPRRPLSNRHNGRSQNTLQFTPGPDHCGQEVLPFQQTGNRDNCSKTQLAHSFEHRDRIDIAPVSPRSNRTVEDVPELLRELAAAERTGQSVRIRRSEDSGGDSLFISDGSESSGVAAQLGKPLFSQDGVEKRFPNPVEAFDELALAVLKRLRKHVTEAVQTTIDTSWSARVSRATRRRLGRKHQLCLACPQSSSSRQRCSRKRKQEEEETSVRPHKRKTSEQENVDAATSSARNEESMDTVKDKSDETDAAAEDLGTACRQSRRGPSPSSETNLAGDTLRNPQMRKTVAHASTAIEASIVTCPMKQHMPRSQSADLGIASGRKPTRSTTDTTAPGLRTTRKSERQQPPSGDGAKAKKETEHTGEVGLQHTSAPHGASSAVKARDDILGTDLFCLSSENEYLACSPGSQSAPSQPTSSGLSCPSMPHSPPPSSPSSLLPSVPHHRRVSFPSSCAVPSAAVPRAFSSPVPSRKGSSAVVPHPVSSRQVTGARTSLSSLLSSSRRPLSSACCDLIDALSCGLCLLFNSSRYPPRLVSGNTQWVRRLCLHLTFLMKRMKQLRRQMCYWPFATEAPCARPQASAGAGRSPGSQIGENLLRRKSVGKRGTAQRSTEKSDPRRKEENYFPFEERHHLEKRGVTRPNDESGYERRGKKDESPEGRRRTETRHEQLDKARRGLRYPRAPRVETNEEAAFSSWSAGPSHSSQARLWQKKATRKNRKAGISRTPRLLAVTAIQRLPRAPEETNGGITQPCSSCPSLCPTSPRRGGCPSPSLSSPSSLPSSASVASPVFPLQLPRTLSSKGHRRAVAAAMSLPSLKVDQQTQVSFSQSASPASYTLSPQAPSFAVGCRVRRSGAARSRAAKVAPVSPEVHTPATRTLPRIWHQASSVGDPVGVLLKGHDRFRLGRLTQQQRALLHLLLQSKRLVCLFLRVLLAPLSFSEAEASPFESPSSACSSFPFQQDDAGAADACTAPPSSFVFHSYPVVRRHPFPALPCSVSTFSSSASSPSSSPSPSPSPSPSSSPSSSSSSSGSQPSPSSTALPSSSPGSADSSSASSMDSVERRESARDAPLPPGVYGGPQTLIRALQMYFTYRPGAGRRLLRLLPQCIVEEEDKVLFQPLSWREGGTGAFRGQSRKERTIHRESYRRVAGAASDERDEGPVEPTDDERMREGKKRNEERVTGWRRTAEDSKDDRNARSESEEGPEGGSARLGDALGMDEIDERARQRREHDRVPGEETGDEETQPMPLEQLEGREQTSQERQRDVPTREQCAREVDTARLPQAVFRSPNGDTTTGDSLFLHRKTPSPSLVASVSSRSCSSSSGPSPYSSCVFSPASGAFLRLPETAFASLCGFLCGDLLPLLQACRYLRSAVLSTFGTSQQHLNLLMVDVDDTRFPTLAPPAATPPSLSLPSESSAPATRALLRPSSAESSSLTPSFSSFRYTHLAQAFKKDKEQLLYLLRFWRGSVEAWVEPRQLAELLECMDSLGNIRELSLFSDERMHAFFSQEEPGSPQIFDETLRLSDEEHCAGDESRKEPERHDRPERKQNIAPFRRSILRRKRWLEFGPLDIPFGGSEDDPEEEKTERGDRGHTRITGSHWQGEAKAQTQ